MQDKSTAAVNVTERCAALLERIHAFDVKLRCYVAIDEDAVVREAARLGAVPEGDRGPLHGTTLAVKDIIDVAGLPTRAGSAFFRRDPVRDAPVVEVLRAAGALVVGKTNTHEFAWGVTTENPHFGWTANPWDGARSPGGSSGGSGAAVAAGLADCALGSDTLGSIRIPSALNGVCGLRPALDALSLDGIFPLAPGFDTAGPFARDFQTLTLLYEVLSQRRLREPGTIRVCRLRGEGWERVDPSVARAVDDAVASFGEGGIVVDDVVWWDSALLPAVAVIQQRAAAKVHESMYARHSDAYGADVATRVAGALKTTQSEERAARETVAHARRNFSAAIAAYDVALCPGSAGEAPFSPAPATFREETISLMAAATAFGLPVAAAPIGFGPAGMPLGMQLVSLSPDASPALALGRRFQELTNWHTRRPAL